MKVFLLKFHDMYVQFEACRDMLSVHSFPSNTLFFRLGFVKSTFLHNNVSVSLLGRSRRIKRIELLFEESPFRLSPEMWRAHKRSTLVVVRE